MPEQLTEHEVPEDWSTVKIAGFEQKDAAVVRARLLSNLTGDPDAMGDVEGQFTLDKGVLHACARPKAFFERLQSDMPEIKLDFAA